METNRRRKMALAGLIISVTLIILDQRLLFTMLYIIGFTVSAIYKCDLVLHYPEAAICKGVEERDGGRSGASSCNCMPSV